MLQDMQQAVEELAGARQAESPAAAVALAAEAQEGLVSLSPEHVTM